jgi:hypothetical protein
LLLFQHCIFKILYKKTALQFLEFRILAEKETLRQTLTMTSHTVNINTSLLLCHEGIYDYHNDAFLQISKITQS